MFETALCVSVSFETQFLKLGANALDCFGRRWAGIPQLICDPQRVPLEATHLMERQNIDTLNDAQACREAGDLRYVGQIVG